MFKAIESRPFEVNMKKLFIIFFLVLLVAGCSKRQDSPRMDYTGAQEIAYALQDDLDHGLENTDAMIEAIYARAKEDAKNITPEMTDQALAYLAVNFTSDPFGGNLVMESCMYFGVLLDKAFDDSDVRSEVGWDAYKSIKYVYRGMETEADAAFAVEQVLEGLLELGYVQYVD
jgi:hypothetical protein